MDVSGSGKTTIGEMLASEVGGEFIDADEHHSAANINKMKGGDPLTDDDRENWLESIAHLIQTHRSKQTLVVACSAFNFPAIAHLGDLLLVPSSSCDWKELTLNTTPSIS